MNKKFFKKIVTFFSLLLVIFSSILINTFVNNSDVSASSVAGTTQTYVEIEDMYRDDNEIYFKLKEKLQLKDITYEYTHVVNGEVESDLVNMTPAKEDTLTYKFSIESDTIAVKIWKIKYKETEDYFKNKYTTGKNQVGEITSVKKKNYVTVTADKLVAYEYTCEAEKSGKISSVVESIGDYLFKDDKCASYTWFFSVDKQMDEIIKVDMEYATFEYTEAFWGVVESKHDYKTHYVTISPETEVYNYPGLSDFVNSYCDQVYGKDGLGYTQCVQDFMNSEKESFKRPAVGSTEQIGFKEDYGYDWYVQISLNDLLKENNFLNGLYENKGYLQEVALLKISYYFEGQEYYDINVLDEDTGELIIVPDESPFDKAVATIEDIIDFIVDLFNKVKNNQIKWWQWVLAVIVLILLITIIRFIIKVISKIFGLDKKSRLDKEEKEIMELKLEVLSNEKKKLQQQLEEDRLNNIHKADIKKEKKQEKEIENKYTSKKGKKKW